MSDESNTKITQVPSNRKLTWLAQLSSLLASIAAVAGLTFLLNYLMVSRAHLLTTPDFERLLLQARTDREKELSREIAAMKDLQIRLDDLMKTPLSSDDAKKLGLIKLQEIQSQLAKLEKQLNELNTIILENPNKALSLTLLQREIEKVKLDNSKQEERSTKQVDRLYDQNKWFIGLIITMFVALISLAISNFVQARKKS